jgi:OOP family OmpA-OmpF porin
MTRAAPLSAAAAGLACALCAALLGSCLILASAAKADDIDTQRFAPYATSGGFLQTEGTQTRYAVDPFSLGVWLSFAHQPLVAVNSHGDVVEKIVGTQLGLDLSAAYAFTDWFELGLHAPLSYLAGDNLGTAALGDIRMLPKFTFLRDDRAGFGLGLLTELRLPTHTEQFSGGARNVAGGARLLLDHRFGLSGLRLGLELGVLLREATHYRNVTAGSEFQAGLGLGYRFDSGHSPVELLFDLRSAIGLAKTDPEEVSLEGLAGVAVNLTQAWKLHVSAGLGLLEGFGVPTFRGIAGVRWEPAPNDPDHDGLASSRQLLQKQSEQLDPNASAQPTAANATEKADAVDDAERAQAIREGYDACPTLPEDFDGVEDDDGCPEGDEDGDGVLDYLDRCPHEDETINGFEDDDGCPDAGPAQIVIEAGKITILETIRFRPNSSEIDPSSYPIVDQIALALRKHRELEQIEIGGHTDDTGPREFNMQLSRARARSVRQYLLARGGIRPERLQAQGYGPDHPIGDNASEDGRAQNRRVEFVTKH